MARNLRYRVDVALGDSPENLQQLVNQINKVKGLISELGNLQSKNAGKFEEGIIVQRRGYQITTEDLDRLVAKQKELNKQLSQASKSFLGAKELVDNFRKITTELNSVNKQLSKLATTGDVKKLQRDVKNLNTNLTKTRSEVASLNKIKFLDNKTFNTGVKTLNSSLSTVNKNLTGIKGKSPEVEQSTRSMGRSASSASVNFKQLGTTLLQVFGVTRLIDATVDAFREVVRVGAEFEAQMSAVGAITQATSQEFARLEENSRRLGAVTSFTATDAARGAEILAVAGFNVQEILNAQEGVLRLAESASVSLEKAADVAAITLRGYGIEASRIAEVNEVLTNSFTSANLTLDSFNEANKLVAPLAKSTGLELQETAAIINTLADAGFRGSIGGTALRAILVQLNKPSDKAKKALEGLGISFEQIRQEGGNLVDVIERLNEQQVTAEEVSLIFGKQAAAVSILLQQQSRAADGTAASLREISSSLGVVGTAARAIQEPFRQVAESNAQFLQSINDDNTADFAKTLGDALVVAERFNASQERTDQVLRILRERGVEGAAAISTLEETFQALSSPQLLAELDRLAGNDPNAPGAFSQQTLQNIDGIVAATRELGVEISSFGAGATSSALFSDIQDQITAITDFDIKLFSAQLDAAAKSAERFNLDLGDTAAVVGQIGGGAVDSTEAFATLNKILTGVAESPALAVFRTTATGLGALTQVIGDDGTPETVVANVGLLIDALDSAGVAASDLGLVGDEVAGFNQLLDLAGGSAAETSARFDQLKTSVEEYSNTQDIAEQRLDNVQGDFKILTSATQELAITIFERLSPGFRIVIQEVTDIVRSITAWVSTFNDIVTFIKSNLGFFARLGRVIQVVVTAVVAWRAAQLLLNISLGGLRAIGNVVIGAVRGLAVAFNFVTGASTGSTVSLQAFKAALISTGVGAFVVLLGTLISAFVSLSDETERTIETQQRLNETLAAAQENATRVAQSVTQQVRIIQSGVLSERERAAEVRKLVQEYGNLQPNLQAILENRENVAAQEQLIENLVQRQTLEQEKQKAIIEANAQVEAARAAQTAISTEITNVTKEIGALNAVIAENDKAVRDSRANIKLSAEERRKILDDAIRSNKATFDSIRALEDEREELIKRVNEAQDDFRLEQETARTISSPIDARIKELENQTRDFNIIADQQTKQQQQLADSRQRFIQQFLRDVQESAKGITDAEAFITEQTIKLNNSIRKERESLQKSGLLDPTEQFFLSDEVRKEAQKRIEELARASERETQAQRDARDKANKEFQRSLDDLRRRAQKAQEDRLKETREGIIELRTSLIDRLRETAGFARLTAEQQFALVDKINRDLSKSSAKIISDEIDFLTQETQRKIQVINTAFEREAAELRAQAESRIAILQQQFDQEIITRKQFNEETVRITTELNDRIQEARRAGVDGTEFVAEEAFRQRREQSASELRILENQLSEERRLIIQSRDERIEDLKRQVEERKLSAANANAQILSIEESANIDLLQADREFSLQRINIRQRENLALSELEIEQTEGLNSLLTLQVREQRKILDVRINELRSERDLQLRENADNRVKQLEIEREFSDKRTEFEEQYFDFVTNLRIENADSDAERIRIRFIQANKVYEEGLLETERLLGLGNLNAEEAAKRRQLIEENNIKAIREIQGQTSVIDIINVENNNNQLRLQNEQLQADLTEVQKDALQEQLNNYSAFINNVREKFSNVDGDFDELAVFGQLRQNFDNFQDSLTTEGVKEIIAQRTEVVLELLGVSLQNLEKQTPELRARARNVLVAAGEEFLEVTQSQSADINTEFDNRRKAILAANARQRNVLEQQVTDAEELATRQRELADQSAQDLQNNEGARLAALQDLEEQSTSTLLSLFQQRQEILREERDAEIATIEVSIVNEEERAAAILKTNEAYRAQVKVLQGEVKAGIDDINDFTQNVPVFDSGKSFIEARDEIIKTYDAIIANQKAVFDDDQLQKKERDKLDKTLAKLKSDRDKAIEDARKRAVDDLVASQTRLSTEENTQFENNLKFIAAQERLANIEIINETRKQQAIAEIQNLREQEELRHQNELLNIQRNTLIQRLALLTNDEDFEKRRTKLQEELNKVNKALADNNAKTIENATEAEELAIQRRIKNTEAFFEDLNKVFESVNTIFSAISGLIVENIEANIAAIEAASEKRTEIINEDSAIAQERLSNERALAEDEAERDIQSATLRADVLGGIERRFTRAQEEEIERRDKALAAEEKAKEEALKAEEVRKQRAIALEQSVDAVKQVLAAAEQARILQLQIAERTASTQRAAQAVVDTGRDATLTASGIGAGIGRSASLGPAGIIAIASLLATVAGAFVTVRNLVKSFRADAATLEEGGLTGDAIREGDSIKRGGPLVGKSHAQGGMFVEVEGKEFVINKAGYKLYPNLTNAINEEGRRKMRGLPLRGIDPSLLLGGYNGGHLRYPKLGRNISMAYGQEGGAIIAGTRNPVEVVNSEGVESRLDSLITAVSNLKLELNISELKDEQERIELVESEASL